MHPNTIISDSLEWGATLYLVDSAMTKEHTERGRKREAQIIGLPEILARFPSELNAEPDANILYVSEGERDVLAEISLKDLEKE